MTPRVSIILTTYNRAPLLKLALQSVADQTFTDYELLVVDDGSTDETPQLLANWPHPLHLIQQPHHGRPEPLRNIGLTAAKGPIIAFLDDDDQWRPDYLARQMAHFEADTTVGLTYCDAQFLSPDNTLSTPRLEPERHDGTHLLDHLLDGWAAYPSLIMFRRSLLEKTGPINETLFTQGDYDFLLRLAFHTTAVCTPKPLVILHRDDAGLSVQRERLHYENALTVLKEFTNDHPLSPRQQRTARRTQSRFHNHLARLDLVAGQPQAARQHFRQSLSLWPRQRKAWAGLLKTFGPAS